jgi:predicted dehydrogenase
MNQAPHHLDLLCHLAGQPEIVFATTRTARHAIQTEDTVQAHLEWNNGALGSLHASTAEAGPPERIVITGTAGILEIGDKTIRHWRFVQDIDEHIANAEPFATLEMREIPVTLESGAGDHAAAYRQFLAAVQTGAPFTDGVEGRMSLELANAMIFSSHTASPVRLPIDRAAYASLLNRLCLGSEPIVD